MLPMQTTAYTAERIFTGTEWLTDKAVIVAVDKIQSIISLSELNGTENLRNFAGSFIAPAFIDVQLYGAYGKLLATYPNAESVSLINTYCRAGGAVLCLPTVATNTKEVFYACIDAVRDYWNSGGKGVWGLHLEGPWLNKLKRGAHTASLIHAPEIEEVASLLQYGKGIIKMITLAPELCSAEVIQLIRAEGVIISAGHSNVAFEEATKAFNEGITTVTHLYNAMSPLQHRAPGLVGAVLAHNKVKSSIIADGHHVDFAAIKIAQAIMKDRLFVITDAVTETSEGLYRHQPAGDKYECDGILSGSAITMFQSFRNLVHKVEIEVDEALRMCSLYPAQMLGCDGQYGKIAPGYAAQFILVDKQLEEGVVITL